MLIREQFNKQINFTANLDRAENTTMFFIIEEAKQTALNFSRGTVKVLWAWFNFYQYKMTQYNSLNVNLLNSQLNKLKSVIKNELELVLRLSSNMIGDDETNFPHKLLLTNRQVSNLRKAFADKSSTDVKLSRTQISRMIQSGGFLGRRLTSLLKTGLPLIKNVIKPLTKSVLIPLGLTAAVSAADAEIHKKILGSGTTTLIISNDEMKDIIRIVKSFEKGGFLSMLLGTLSASLLGNVLAGKRAIAKWQGRGINKAREEVIRAGYENKSVKKTTKWIINDVLSFN